MKGIFVKEQDKSFPVYLSFIALNKPKQMKNER